MSERVTTVEQVLDGAIDAMRQRGWTQGNYEDPTGELCLRGALRVGAWGSTRVNLLEGPTSATWELCRDADWVVAGICYEQYGILDVPGVNDRRLKTADEAIAILEKARAKAGEAGA